MNESHALAVGKLVVNLQGLEYALRAFLLKHNEASEPQVDTSKLKQGDMVPANSFTNYDTLGMLVDKFNGVAGKSCPACQVDRAVVAVRDMLAHGRIASPTGQLPLELVKFGKEKNGRVPVEHVVTVDCEWLSSNIRLVCAQMGKVLDASNRMGQGIMERA